MILCEVCPVCERERFNAEELGRLNAKIRAARWRTDQTTEAV